LWLFRERLHVARSIHHDAHQADAGDAVHHAMVHLGQHGGAAALQAADDEDFPERLIAVHHRAEQLAGQGLQRGIVARGVEIQLENVIADVEVGIVLPTGVSDVEGRRDHALAVAGNEM
jgi:hypothetical protein